MRIFFRFVSVAAATAGLAISTASAQVVEIMLVKELLELSGAKHQILLIPRMIKEAAAQKAANEKLDPKKRQKLEVVLQESYQPDAFLVAVEHALKDGVSKQSIKEILAFYKSPVGKRIKAAELAALRKSPAEAEAELAERLEKNPPEKSRVELVKKIDSVAGATDLSVETLVGTVNALAVAMNPALPAEKQVKSKQLDHVALNIRKNTRKRIEHQTLLSFLYTYDSVSDDDLRAYLNHLKSPSARRFGQALSKALKKSISASATKVGKAVGRSVAGK